MHLQDESILILSSKHKYVHLKTHWASHTLHQNLVAIWQWSNYSKNSFIVLIQLDGAYWSMVTSTSRSFRDSSLSFNADALMYKRFLLFCSISTINSRVQLFWTFDCNTFNWMKQITLHVYRTSQLPIKGGS